MIICYQSTDDKKKKHIHEVYSSSQHKLVNGAIIVNRLNQKAMVMLLFGKEGSIALLIPVNKDTPSFPVELRE
jgi:hypothetical protein